MKILGIDTSCDDTCVALLEIKDLRFKILNNVVSSQVKLHAKYGGVYPFLAKREHQKNLPIVFKKAIKGIDILKIDLIGVTVGPGLEPCLWQGVNFAKDLAEKLKKPLVSVNHIEAHIVANFLNLKSEILNLKFIFPAVCLVVSGGHTQLILMKAIGKYKLIGETRDDAAGECFDKVARILGLGYPGGPAIDAEAATLNLKPLTLNLRLPRPMIYQKNYDFSFSGLKTAVLYDFRKQKPKIRKSREYIREMCREAQQAIIDVLIRKTIKAAKDYKAKSIILGGGVAANDELRRQFALNLKSEILNLKFLVPPKIFCTDNAAMVAVTACFHQEDYYLPTTLPPSAGPYLKNWQKIKANASLRI